MNEPSASDRTRVLVAGSATMIGAALVGRFSDDAGSCLVGIDQQPEWSDARAVDAFVGDAHPDEPVVAAGQTGVGKLLYLTSSCTYPRDAARPLTTDALWTGPVEATSGAYATAKLAGMRLCEAYRQQHGARFSSAVVADAFGPGDDCRPDGHGDVVGALISRMHAARLAGSACVTIWGSGQPRREFLHVDDRADAVAFLMRRDESAPVVNIGTGVTTSIRQLAEILREVVGFEGELVFDTTRPDGAPVKWLDSAPLHALGWSPRWELRAALVSTYRWFRAQRDRAGSVD